MTELECLQSFILECSTIYPDLKRDAVKLGKIIKHLKTKNRVEDYLDRFVRALLSFSDALVFGLNSRRFAFESEVLARKALCVYPRFLSGLTTMVFHDNGTLREDWNRQAFELLLQMLAFVKRFKHPLLKKRADSAAYKEFIKYQSITRPVHESVASHLRAFWNYFARDFEKYPTIGFPGPGATLDELHPYSPEHVYLNTWDPNLPDEIKQFYDACFAAKTGFPSSREWSLDSSHSEVLPQFYQLKENPTLRSVTVPKNSKVSRVITITNVGNTIVGACYRNTVKALWRKFGIEHQLNVDDQTLSHRTLEKHFSRVSALDLEGGSSCFTNNLNSKILPDPFHDFLEYVEQSTFEAEGEEYPVTTQLMGDSISTALLTTSLYLAICLAEYYRSKKRYILKAMRLWNKSMLRRSETFSCYDFSEYFGSTFMPRASDIAEAMKRVRKMPVNVVGDDIIIPSYLEFYLRQILKSLGITVNDRKSSTRSSLHKESCGCWFIKGEHGPYRIYPFRFPEGNTLPEQYQSATEFLQRTRNSTYVVELTLALASVYGPEVLKESYTSDQIGSPVGAGLPCSIRSRTRQLSGRINDTDAYLFGVGAAYEADPRLDSVPFSKNVTYDSLISGHGEHFITYRMSRRAVPSTTRYRRFNDVTRSRTRCINSHIRGWLRHCLIPIGLGSTQSLRGEVVYRFLSHLWLQPREKSRLSR